MQIKAIATEHNLTVFDYKAIINEQVKLTWLEQFFDGSPHKTEVEATSIPGSNRQFVAVKVAQEVVAMFTTGYAYVPLIYTYLKKRMRQIHTDIPL